MTAPSFEQLAAVVAAQERIIAQLQAIAAIGRLIGAWNDRCTPFTRTKDPDTVIAKATHRRNRKTRTTSDTEHQDLKFRCAGRAGEGQVTRR